MNFYGSIFNQFIVVVAANGRGEEFVVEALQGNEDRVVDVENINLQNNELENEKQLPVQQLAAENQHIVPNEIVEGNKVIFLKKKLLLECEFYSLENVNYDSFLVIIVNFSFF